MIRKPLESITLDDVNAFVAEQYPEGKTIDYKRDFYRLSGGTPDYDKRQHIELLKDVSSFANSIGGDLMIGIEESGGVPTNIAGISVPNLDALKLQISQIVERGIQPRLGIAIHGVEVSANQYVLIIRIHRSMIGPHRVVYRGQNDEFFARNSAGTFAMDVSDLRQAFNLSGSLYEQIKNFRKDRVTEIIEDRTPVILEQRARVICHLIPMESFASRINIEPATFEAFNVPPFTASVGYRAQFNIDGHVWHDGAPPVRPATAYAQMFRNGIIESVSDQVVFFSQHDTERKTRFFSTPHVTHIQNNFHYYLKSLMRVAVPPPVWCFFTYTGMKDVTMYSTSHIVQGHPIDRDILYLPEIEISDLNPPRCDALLKPVFDMVWNAAGYRQCPMYNGDQFFSDQH